MALLGPAVEIGSGRDTEFTATQTRHYTRIFRVTTDSALDGPKLVLGATGLPAPYSSYSSAGTEFDPFALCVSCSPREEGESRTAWLVTCKYSSDVIQKQENPLNDPPIYRLTFDQFTRVARTDVDGKPITNTMGDIFVPPITVDDSRPVYSITHNEPFLNLSFWADYRDSVNTSAIWGMGARCIKVKSITAGDTQNRNNVTFYTVTYEFALNTDTWDFKILNQGFRYQQQFSPGTANVTWKGSDPITIYAKDGGPPTPGTTTAGKKNQLAPTPYTGDPDYIYITKRIYKERDFSAFGF